MVVFFMVMNPMGSNPDKQSAKKQTQVLHAVDFFKLQRWIPQPWQWFPANLLDVFCYHYEYIYNFRGSCLRLFFCLESFQHFRRNSLRWVYIPPHLLMAVRPTNSAYPPPQKKKRSRIMAPFGWYPCVNYWANSMGLLPTWRIIPVSKWLITMVSKSPKWGYSPYKWPKWLINGGY